MYCKIRELNNYVLVYFMLYFNKEKKIIRIWKIWVIKNNSGGKKNELKMNLWKHLYKMNGINIFNCSAAPYAADAARR